MALREPKIWVTSDVPLMTTMDAVECTSQVEDGELFVARTCKQYNVHYL